jgi:hypothetical protein
VPAKVVAQIMGHTKVDTTMNVYTQVLDGAARAAADRVGSELFRVVQIPDGRRRHLIEKSGSSGWTRTNNPPVNSSGSYTESEATESDEDPTVH